MLSSNGKGKPDKAREKLQKRAPHGFRCTAMLSGVADLNYVGRKRLEHGSNGPWSRSRAYVALINTSNLGGLISLVGGPRFVHIVLPISVTDTELGESHSLLKNGSR